MLWKANGIIVAVYFLCTGFDSFEDSANALEWKGFAMTTPSLALVYFNVNFGSLLVSIPDQKGELALFCGAEDKTKGREGRLVSGLDAKLLEGAVQAIQ